MGLNIKVHLPLINDLVENKLGGYRGISMIELGNQMMKNKPWDPTWSTPAKQYFSKLGVEHISIDLNGRNGALRLNLGEEIKTLPPADMITNFGTSEHVANQYECFKNVHNLCKKGGFVIHTVPPPNSWPDHCNYYYTLDFFKQLGIENKYYILENRLLSTIPYVDENKKNLILCVYRKPDEEAFISYETWMKKLDPLLVRSSDHGVNRYGLSANKRGNK